MLWNKPVLCCRGHWRFTSNWNKVVLSDILYPLMKHLYPDESGLIQVDNSPLPSGTRTCWIVWWESYAVTYAVSRPTCLPEISTTILSKPTEGISFGKLGFHPSSRDPQAGRANTNVDWSFSGGRCWTSALPGHCRFSPYVFHLSVSKTPSPSHLKCLQKHVTELFL